jgi:hypothetical protein
MLELFFRSLAIPTYDKSPYGFSLRLKVGMDVLTTILGQPGTLDQDLFWEHEKYLRSTVISFFICDPPIRNFPGCLSKCSRR